MTYGRERLEGHTLIAQGAAVSHLAELVRGEFLSWQGPLIRPFGPPSPQGEKGAVARFGAPLRPPRMDQARSRAIHLMFRLS
jgi:hypothetical protein